MSTQRYCSICIRSSREDGRESAESDVTSGGFVREPDPERRVLKEIST